MHSSHRPLRAGNHSLAGATGGASRAASTAVHGRPWRSSWASRALLGALVCSSVVAGACAQPFDTTRQTTEPTLTLGDDIYQTLCDRVAATADPTDLEGRRSWVVCHPDSTGAYANNYLAKDLDPSRFGGLMPPKVAVMVKYRTSFIAAMNATFPDTDSLHGDLDDLLKQMIGLYDDDTIPESTRTLAAILDTVAFTNTTDDPYAAPPNATAAAAEASRATDVRTAFARLGGRKGYRTLDTAIGVARPLLAYADMANVIDTTISLIGPGGAAEPQLERMLSIAQAEMQTSSIPAARKPITGYVDRFSGNANAPPKIISEILRNVLLDPPPSTEYPATWATAYATLPSGTVSTPLPILQRDVRGFASFNVLPSNTIDKDGDGLPDVDSDGRFVDAAGNPIALPSPFPLVATPGTIPDSAPRDSSARALTATGGKPIYVYTDAQQTILAAALRDLKPVADPANGALLDFANVARYQFGPRSASTSTTDPTLGPDIATYADPDGGSAQQIPYRKFDATQSPLTDLMYAGLRTLEYPNVDDYLSLTQQLLRDHPDKVARLVGAALAAREIAKKPIYASVVLSPKSTLWDDVIAVVQQMAAEPELMSPVVGALANSDVLLLQPAMAAFFANNDQLDYDPTADGCTEGADTTCPAINNATWDVTTNVAATIPSSLNDLTKDDETNRSIFERFLSLMHDTWGVSSCNKQGATIESQVSIPIIGHIDVNLPLGGGTYDECAAINIPDLAEFYLGCVSGGVDEVTGKARCNIPVNDDVVSALNDIGLGNELDSILQSTSGINGMTQTPTVQALNRLVMWREPNQFIQKLFDPMTTVVCPVTNTSTNHRDCSSTNDLLANRQRATIFQGEIMQSLKGLAPLITPFVARVEPDKSNNLKLFLGLIDVFNEHWGTGNNTVRCAAGAKPGDPKYCTGSNVRQYEALISDVLANTDLLPALNDLTVTLQTMKFDGGTKSGIDVTAELVNDLLSPTNAAGLGLTNRDGTVGTTDNAGNPIAQVTPFYLFANALIKMDAQWTGPTAAADHATWQAARSKLVDQFLSVTADGGDVTKSHFTDPAIQAALPIVIDVLEDRLAQHRAAGDLHTWVTTTAVSNFTTSMSGPTFATSIDLINQIYANTTARTTLGNLLVYLLDQASDNAALANVVTATQDLLQVIADDTDLVPLEHALSIAAAPDGATKRALDLIERGNAIETSTAWVTAHAGRRVLSHVLGNAVIPMTPGGAAPLQVIMDLVADIQRADPTQTGAFDAPDYGSVSFQVEDFLLNPTRGLEQFYTIVKNRNLN